MRKIIEEIMAENFHNLEGNRHYGPESTENSELDGPKETHNNMPSGTIPNNSLNDTEHRTGKE